MEFHFKDGDEFIRVVRQITTAASKDPAQPGLKLVKIEVEDTSGAKILRLLATDGFVLAAAVIFAECEETIPYPCEFSIHASDLAEIVHGRVKEIRKEGIRLDFADNGAWTYQVGKIQGRFLQAKEGQHPNFQVLFDGVEGIDSKHPSITLGRQTIPYLAHLSKVSEEPINIWINDNPDGPMLIRSGVYFSALVMPVKFQKDLYFGLAELPVAEGDEGEIEGLVALS